jgi:hypothetical protein
MTGGGLRAATLRRRPRLLSVGEQRRHAGVGPDTIQRRQRQQAHGIAASCIGEPQTS